MRILLTCSAGILLGLMLARGETIPAPDAAMRAALTTTPAESNAPSLALSGITEVESTLTGWTLEAAQAGVALPPWELDAETIEQMLTRWEVTTNPFEGDISLWAVDAQGQAAEVAPLMLAVKRADWTRGAEVKLRLRVDATRLRGQTPVGLALKMSSQSADARQSAKTLIDKANKRTRIRSPRQP